MYANERRSEIIKILEGRRKEQIKNLASQLGVSIRTIKNDILILATEYPIETVRGNGGGVRLMDGFHTYRNDISREQQELLISLMSTVDKRSKKLIKEIILTHGSILFKKIAESLD